MSLIINPYRFVTASGGSLFDEIIADSPVWYARLNDTSGIIAVRTVGSVDGQYVGGTINNSAIYTGGPVCWKGVSAPSVAGVTIPASVLTSATQLSVECVYRPASISGMMQIISRDRDTGDRKWQFRQNGANIELIKIAGSVESISASSAASIGVSMHLTFTINSTGTSAIYKNGVSVASGDFADADYGSLTRDITVGSRDNVDTANPGYFSEIAIYNHVLSSARVLVHAQAAGF